MTGGYWQVEPQQPARERDVSLVVPGVRTVQLVSADGVFGARRVDHGTSVLIRSAPTPRECTSVVDLGTGYGPIAIAMGLRQPTAGVWAVDVNRRALRLAHRNAASLGLHGVVTAEPAAVPVGLRFDRLYSNPPVKIGRDQLHDLLGTWLRRLTHGGDGYLVVKQSMGADALHTWLNSAGFPTLRAASKQGYRLLRVGQSGGIQQPRGLSTADLARVNRATGRSWSVLGRMAGGSTGSIQLLGAGAARAVVKVKVGARWGDRLPALRSQVTGLRAAGYPTPRILGVGPLDGDRHFLATGFGSGSQPGEVDMPLAEQLCAAAQLHTAVQPPPERDWSAMITLFLNGGIRAHRFQPELAGLAAQALRLVEHPVPALPGSEFVHGDFTIPNVLVNEGRLTAVIGLEGFGRGTRAIDLVALLASILGHAPAEAVAAVKDRAVAAAGEQAFLACLAHRILAWLLSATDRPGRVTAVAHRARGLLALVD